MVKNLPAMGETQVQCLGWEDSMEKGMATHSNILVWNDPWAEEPGKLVRRASKSGTWLSELHTHTHTHTHTHPMRRHGGWGDWHWPKAPSSEYLRVVSHYLMENWSSMEHVEIFFFHFSLGIHFGIFKFIFKWIHCRQHLLICLTSFLL